MATPGEPLPVKPIAGILAASSALLETARNSLEGWYGPVQLASEPVPWDLSPYYQAEMGGEIWRQYVALTELMDPGALAEWKLHTNFLEGSWLTARGRSVNLDPGYVGLDKLILASAKDRAHRIYIGKGIYAEACLRFVHGSFAAWPYTYRDYAWRETLDFFNLVRERYRREIAGVRDLPSV